MDRNAKYGSNEHDWNGWFHSNGGIHGRNVSIFELIFNNCILIYILKQSSQV